MRRSRGAYAPRGVKPPDATQRRPTHGQCHGCNQTFPVEELEPLTKGSDMGGILCVTCLPTYRSTK